jgi:ABC-type dipeptide/oligopeptide/nickel transport system permease subunit
MIDPQHEIEGALSAEVPTPAPGLSDVAARLLARDTEVGVVQLGQGQLIWRRFRKHKLAMIGAVTLVLLVLMAIFAPVVSPETYANFNYDISVHNLAPSLAWPWSSGWKYVLGTDANGHSLVMWIAYGARVSLMVGILSSILTMILAIVLGGVAGYFGGWVDAVVMRITDVFLTLPTLRLLILLADYLASGSATVIIILFAVLSWPGNARLVRSYYLTFRSQEFTEAARAVGVGDARIIFRHILPNALSPIIVAATLAVAGLHRDRSSHRLPGSWNPLAIDQLGTLAGQCPDLLHRGQLVVAILPRLLPAADHAIDQLPGRWATRCP